ncbi:MAG: hypothetical protein ACOH2M_28265 [Cypionkella sp.]
MTPTQILNEVANARKAKSDLRAVRIKLVGLGIIRTDAQIRDLAAEAGQPFPTKERT